MDLDFDEALTAGQRTLYDLGDQDLQESCVRYAQTVSPQHGQQVLADLRRMQSLIHKHMGLMANVSGAHLYPQKPGAAKPMLWEWCWAGAFAEDTSLAWGRSHQAVRQFLSDAEPQLLTGLAHMKEVSARFELGKRTPRTLWVSYGNSPKAFLGGSASTETSAGTLRSETRFRSTSSSRKETSDQPLTLDELINGWADEANGQFLYGAPDGVILQLQHFQMVEGTWTKRSTELDLSTDVNLPFSEDGINVDMASKWALPINTDDGQRHVDCR